jgi:uncharacterized protein
MNRRDWLILFLSFEGAPRGLDPVRLQKGMFLFAQEAHGVPDREKYTFHPYNYGPMSREIYSDLDRLLHAGLVEATPVEGQSWARYRPTPDGLARGRAVLREAIGRRPEATRYLFEVKAEVASATFASLLEDVYERYPTYAARSVFRRRT